MNTTISNHGLPHLPTPSSPAPAELSPDAAQANLQARQLADNPADDRLNLTPSAQSLQGAAAGEAPQAPVDMRKVHDLREAIAKGTYTIDSQRIASKMLALTGR